MIDIGYEPETMTFTPLTGIARAWFENTYVAGVVPIRYASLFQCEVCIKDMLLSGLVIHSEEATAMWRRYFHITDANVSLTFRQPQVDSPIVNPVIDEADTLRLRGMGVVWA